MNSTEEAETITPVQESQKDQSRPNKFKYPEFEGINGERLLRMTLRKIIPMALKETWEVLATEHQAPGNDAYLSIVKLADARQRTDRKIRLDLAELEARRLLTIRHEWKMLRQPDGSVRPRLVTIKDFERLYDLAYEYLLWENSEWYIEPDREYVEVIRENEVLYKKLRRFDNYRRLLCNNPPGPVPSAKEKEIHRWYREYGEETPPLQAEVSQAVETVQDAADDTTEPIRKLYLQEQLQKELQKDSSNSEVTNNNKDRQEERNSNSLPGGEDEVDAPTTIGSTTGLIPEEGTNQESTPKHIHQTQHTNKRKEEREGPPANLQNDQESTTQYKTPRTTIESLIHEYVPIMNDHEAMQEEWRMQSAVSQSVNLFERYGVWTKIEIEIIMERAKGIALEKPDDEVRKRNPDDKSANRMPLFYTVLEKCIKGGAPRTVQQMPSAPSRSAPRSAVGDVPRSRATTRSGSHGKPFTANPLQGSGMTRSTAEDLADEIKMNARALGVTTEVVTGESGVSVVVLAWRKVSMTMQTRAQWEELYPHLKNREEQKRLKEQGEHHGTH